MRNCGATSRRARSQVWFSTAVINWRGRSRVHRRIARTGRTILHASQRSIDSDVVLLGFQCHAQPASETRAATSHACPEVNVLVLFTHQPNTSDLPLEVVAHFIGLERQNARHVRWLRCVMRWEVRFASMEKASEEAPACLLLSLNDDGFDVSGAPLNVRRPARRQMQTSFRFAGCSANSAIFHCISLPATASYKFRPPRTIGRDPYTLSPFFASRHSCSA